MDIQIFDFKGELVFGEEAEFNGLMDNGLIVHISTDDKEMTAHYYYPLHNISEIRVIDWKEDHE